MTRTIGQVVLGIGLASGIAFPADLLPNPGFDDPGEGLAAGWTLQSDVGTATATRVDEEGPFLRVERADKGQADLRPAAGSIPVRGTQAYLLTVRIRSSNVAEASHYAELQWFGPAGFLSRDTGAAHVADRWVTVAVGPVRPPDGATSVAVLLRCYEPGLYDFDDVQLVEVEPMPSNLLTNPGFESDGDGDGAPDAWTLTPAGATWDAESPWTGARSIRLQRPAADAPAAHIRQDTVRVEPGRVYELSAGVKSDVFGRELRLAVEWTKGPQVLETAEFRDQTFQAWQRKTLRATSPAEADAANVILELVSDGTIWFDDACLAPQERVAEMTLDLIRPNPRGLIRQGIDEPIVRAACLARTTLEGASASVALADAADTMLERRELTVQDQPSEVTFDVSRLADGSYTVHAEITRADGQVLAAETARVDIVPADAAGVFFGAHGIATVNRAPWFPIGVCSISPLDDEAAGLAAAGFNLLVPGTFSQGTPDDARRLLDRAQELGLYAMEWNNGWVYPPGQTTAEAREQALTKLAEDAGGHPAFLGLMCDEAIWNGVPLADVAHSYHTFRRLMPTKLFWLNLAPRNTIEDLARYCRFADVSGMDIYPVEGSSHSDLPNKTLSVVGDEVDKNHDTVAGRKPIWAILQGFGWSAWEADPAAHKRAPTWEETRFMAYDSIVHGAVGIIYWGASYEKRDSDIWTSLRRIAGELRDLAPALTSTEWVDIPAESEGNAVRATGRMVDGRLFVIAVNERDTAVEARMTLPDGVDALARVAEEGKGLAARDGAITDAFGPWAVHVYSSPE